MTVIRFHGPDDAWGQISNFYPSPITVDGLSRPTSEQHFRAAKCPGSPHAERIRHAATPGQGSIA